MNKVYESISESKSRATLMRPKTERRSRLRTRHWHLSQIKIWAKNRVVFWFRNRVVCLS